MSRIPLVAGNWKMFKTVQQAIVYAKEFRGVVHNVTDVEIVLAPPFTAVHAVADSVAKSVDGAAEKLRHAIASIVGRDNQH
mgnify:CR=1 FL=1